MRVKAELIGDLREFARDEYLLLEHAVTGGVARAGRGLQSTLRGQVVSSGLGRRLANAWRLNVYPKGGDVSADAAAVVGTKAPHLIRAFDEGATIRSRDGFFLAIPSNAAPAKGVGGKRLTPSNFPEASLGKLRFVYRRNGPSMLVVDNQRVRKGKRAGFALSRSKRALATGRGLATVPMFFLFPQVKLRKRLDVATAAVAAQAALPGLIDAEFARLDRS